VLASHQVMDKPFPLQIKVAFPPLISVVMLFYLALCMYQD